MSSGDHKHFDDAPGSLPRLRAILVKWPDVGAALRIPRRIDHRWSIPYLASISSDARTIYIDRHLPPRIEGIEIAKYLEVHESVEYAIYRVALADPVLRKFLDSKNLYKGCHHLATAAEQYALVSDGYEWDVYRDGLEPYFSPIEHEKVKKFPPDAATYPYNGQELAALQKAQVRSKLDQDEANYLQVAPTARKCALCTMFLPLLHACTMVKGQISHEGSCDKFMPRGAQ